jgi:hypothetical protein
MKIFTGYLLIWLTSLIFFVNGEVVIDSADVVIAGGSLSALAAAITAANVSKVHNTQVTIYLLEPTDWVGGQLTASNVPPDFGNENSVVENLPADFVNLLLAVAGPTWATNPGWCWVSYKCFEVEPAVRYLNTLLSKFSNLKVLYNTVVKTTKRDPLSNQIVGITAIQRTPKGDRTGYENLFSTDVLDWYNRSDSENFTKEIIHFSLPKIVIEASEYMDVLVTSGVEFSQGVEYPNELSDTVDSTCGQSTVYPFYMSYEKQEVTSDDTPPGSDNGVPFSLQGLTWSDNWTYRRAKQSGNWAAAAPGDQSNQNLDNDYRGGYLFLSMDEIESELKKDPSNNWNGGLNITTLSESEQRSFGWYHYLKDIADPGVQPFLAMNATQTGTLHGLAKGPYLRDTRRSQYGVNAFRLTYNDLNYSNPEDNGRTAFHFNDTIGIGVYLYADIHTLLSSNCQNNSYPSYVTCCSHPVKPYYIPFRAITNNKIPNVLIPGKGMAQSFLANAATRLHPIEWVTGTAAGAASILMLEKNWHTTTEVFNHVGELQELLTSELVKSPLVWTL